MRDEWWPLTSGPTPVRVTVADTATGQWAVLVPGFLGGREDFAGLSDELAANGVSSVAYEQRGMNGAPGPAYEAGYSLGHLAADLNDVIACGNERFGPSRPALVAHSYAGLMVQVAMRDPALVSRIGSVTLICSGPGALPPDRQQLLPLLIQHLPTVDRETLWRNKLAYQRASGEPSASADVSDLEGRRWMTSTHHALLAGARVLLTSPRLDAPIRGIGAQVPITVLRGADDDVWSASLQRELAETLGARWCEVAGTGHFPHVNAPRAVSDAILGVEAATRLTPSRTDG